MKKTLPKNIANWIINSVDDDDNYEDTIDVLVKKIIREVRKDYLLELKEDLEVTINMLMKKK
jgi:hypothetical protein